MYYFDFQCADEFFKGKPNGIQIDGKDSWEEAISPIGSLCTSLFRIILL